VVGQHEEDEHFPVQSLALSRCRNILASTSHDNSIKFYDVSQLVRQRAQPRNEVEELPEVEMEGLEKPPLEDDSDVFEDMSDSDDSDE
jgi:WD repeat-containing protein 55